jgi:hypothetical protein
VDETTSVLVEGFPGELHDDVRAVADVMDPPRHVMSAGGERVSVQGETVTIPYRIHNPELPDGSLRRLTERRRLIAGCVYSRHNDGHVREAACAQITESAEPWVVPYVIRLLGEYVVEISALILERLAAGSFFTTDAYAQFVRENRNFVNLTEQRAISYWSCYYRNAYARTDYPALMALDMLRQGASGPA